MLERTAARCLNTRGKTSSFKTSSNWPAECIHSRRTLHSAFWRHGAGDLDLPTWYYSTMQALFEPDETYSIARGDNDGRDSWTAHNGNGFLDFLYPAKTKAMIRRLSTYGIRRWCRHVRQWTLHEVPVRSNTTLATRFGSEMEKDALFSIRRNQTPSRISNEWYNSSEARPTELSKATLKLTPGMRKQRILNMAHKKYPGKQLEKTWLLFNSLDVVDKSPRLINKMISILSFSNLSIDCERIEQLYDMLTADQSEHDTIYCVVEALISIKKYDKALLTYDNAVKSSRGQGHEAAVLLMAYFLKEQRWHSAFHVWALAQQSIDQGLSDSNAHTHDLFAEADRSHGFKVDLGALIDFTLQEHLPASELGNATFFRFVKDLLSSTFRFSEAFWEPGIKLEVLKKIRCSDLTSPAMYSDACLGYLESQEAPMQRRIIDTLKVYDLFKTEQRFEPSRQLLHTMVHHMVGANMLSRIEELLKTWQRLYSNPPPKLNTLFMSGLARLGRISLVKKLLTAQLKRLSGLEVKVQDFHPLLHAYALSGDSDAVREQMRDMEHNFNLKPNTQCWNSLIYAYCRDDNLQGAFRTFEEMLAKNVQLDHYTIGTLMAICAERGDPETIITLRHTAQALKIFQVPIAADCLVLAYLNDGRFDTALETALASSERQSPPAVTRMWNQILMHEALGPSPGNVENTLHIAEQMTNLGIVFDGESYAAIMRAYTLNAELGKASRVMTVQMPEKNVPVTALHYAILIHGYTNQGHHETALRLHARMLAHGLEPGISNHITLIKIHALAAEDKASKDKRGWHPGLRYDLAEEALEEVLQSLDSSIFAERGVQLFSSRYNTTHAKLALLFDGILAVYGRMRAYDTVRALLSRYQEKAKELFPSKAARPQLRLLAMVMQTLDRKGEFNEIAQYWNLSKTVALKYFQSGHIRANRVAQSRQYILSHHLECYIRAKHFQGQTSEIYDVFKDLLHLGFNVDNKNWNLWIQLLALRNRYTEAFNKCEELLMGSWTGWDQASKITMRRDPVVKDKVSLLADSVPKNGSVPSSDQANLRPTHKTIARLGVLIQRLRASAPFDRYDKDKLAEIERNAPRTMEAIVTLPDTLNEFNKNLRQSYRKAGVTDRVEEAKS